MKNIFFNFLLFAVITLIGLEFFLNQNGQTKLNKTIQNIPSTTKNYQNLFSEFFKKTPYEPQAPTLEKIFSDDHNWVATLSGQKITTLVTTGDVMFGRNVNYQAVSEKNFTRLFEKTAAVLKSADISFINLESPLVKNCPVTRSGMTFCGDIRHLEGLTFAGIDVVNLANNHSGNYGALGINNTVNLLKNTGILATGNQQTVFKETKGLRFAFLGYNDFGSPAGISQAINEKIWQEIETAKKESDAVIVAFHWGEEYTPQPSQRQQELAHLAIDSGADLIIGNHPHWIQPVEIYKDKLIVYSHGNFIFDQSWSEKTSQGIIGRFIFYDRKLIDAEFLPVEIEHFGQSSFALEEKKDLILKEMKKETLKLSY